jgi:hypothetical protein
MVHEGGGAVQLLKICRSRDLDREIWHVIWQAVWGVGRGGGRGRRRGAGARGGFGLGSVSRRRARTARRLLLLFLGRRSAAVLFLSLIVGPLLCTRT